MWASLRCPATALRLCRTFFSFPPFSPSQADVQKYSERKVLPYTARQLFDVVANVSLYPKFIPFCTGCRVLSSSDQASGRPYSMEVELTAGFLSFEECYVSEVTCVPFRSVQAIAKSSTPLFTSLSTTWNIQPTPSIHVEGNPLRVSQSVSEESMSNHTLVTFDLAYAFSNPVHAAVSSAFFSQVSKQMVNAFEKRCAEVYGSQKQ
ncbi:hypothetical protein E1B28_004390 [Marasmius oreades]|uniref:Coenzyme Q-binding protein COQ10 START domain-containing protein n=1 Tax=Marasmius oreades TaxID=181124 RepID=A0A9P7UYK4_9AGAR|nr:uncharacterized protein E1B28_004390 [Marasmius oreades]KAG7096995.1 hypothetical protein E1B28_004390 [Marasmius oreades]